MGKKVNVGSAKWRRMKARLSFHNPNTVLSKAQRTVLTFEKVAQLERAKAREAADKVAEAITQESKEGKSKEAELLEKGYRQRGKYRGELPKRIPRSG
jgi:hypothetical protein